MQKLLSHHLKNRDRRRRSVIHTAHTTIIRRSPKLCVHGSGKGWRELAREHGDEEIDLPP
jgi:hypothetical protein